MTSPLCSAREALENSLALLQIKYGNTDPAANAVYEQIADGLSALASSPPTDQDEPDPAALPRCDKLDGSTLRIVPSYTESGRFCEANCLTITDGERAAIYVPYRVVAIASSPPAETEEGEDFNAEQLRQAQADPEWRAKWASHHPEAGAPSREAIRAQLIAILDPIAHSLPDFRQGNINNGADQILSLFSPQSLKASESEDHIPRAVPLSTISEGWRPIETAPKDGTVILLGRLGKDAVFSGWWQDGTEPCGGNGPGWIDGATDRDEDYIVYAGITHWMPLPAPPALSEGDKA